MRVVIQRVLEADVTINNETKAAISKGLLILAGIGYDDDDDDIEWLSKKVVQLRIFDDEQKVPNLSIKEIGGEILLVSQFTLHAMVKKGNRPSYIKAARPEIAIPLYEKLIKKLEQELNRPIRTGTFGADMKVGLLNDGPFTIWIDTKVRE